jgi:hypothetical protein
MRKDMKFMGRRQKRLIEEDPTEGLANLFDVAMVFAVGLMLAIVSYHSLPELIDPNSDVTLVKNPGTPEMEIINKKGETIEVLRATNESFGGAGKKLGTAYELPDGSIIYVPEGMDET